MTSPPSLQFSLCGIGICGAGLDNWEIARAVLRGEQALNPTPGPVPACARLPAAERRRVSKTVNLAMTAGDEAIGGAGMDASIVPSVFATSSADGENCHTICAALASRDPNEHFISPTRFHNSVQNAAAGYWAIATHSMAASITLSAFDGSFAAAMLEAYTMLACGTPEVLAIAFDGPYPEPLHGKRPIGMPMSVALALRAAPGVGDLARLRVERSDARGVPMRQSALEQLRLSSPTGRSLPLLQRVAQCVAGTVALDYLEGTGLAVEIAIP
jgi:hypothetical protein